MSYGLNGYDNVHGFKCVLDRQTVIVCDIHVCDLQYIKALFVCFKNMIMTFLICDKALDSLSGANNRMCLSCSFSVLCLNLCELFVSLDKHAGIL